MGFATTKDCTFPETSPGGVSAVAGSLSFYDMGLAPAGVCMPLNTAFAVLFKKSAYKMTVLSDGAIFGLFVAACLLAIALYVLSMYIRKVGPYAPDGSWADYLLNLKAASIAAAAAAQKAAQKVPGSADTGTSITNPMGRGPMASLAVQVDSGVVGDEAATTTLNFVATGGTMGITAMRSSSASERKAFGCSVMVCGLAPAGVLAKLKMRVPSGMASINGVSVRGLSRDEVAAACKAAAAGGGTVELKVVYPPAGYAPEHAEDEESAAAGIVPK